MAGSNPRTRCPTPENRTSEFDTDRTLPIERTAVPHLAMNTIAIYTHLFPVSGMFAPNSGNAG